MSSDPAPRYFRDQVAFAVWLAVGCAVGFGRLENPSFPLDLWWVHLYSAPLAALLAVLLSVKQQRERMAARSSVIFLIIWIAALWYLYTKTWVWSRSGQEVEVVIALQLCAAVAAVMTVLTTFVQAWDADRPRPRGTGPVKDR